MGSKGEIGISCADVPSEFQIFGGILFEGTFLVPKHRLPAIFYLPSFVDIASKKVSHGIVNGLSLVTFC
jgi:hypothetical protein